MGWGEEMWNKIFIEIPMCTYKEPKACKTNGLGTFGSSKSGLTRCAANLGTGCLSDRLGELRQIFLPTALQPVHPFAESISLEASYPHHLHFGMNAARIGDG